jgi:hypothetical protein
MFLINIDDESLNSNQYDIYQLQESLNRFGQSLLPSTEAQ